ncbi:aminotransferase class I/II-fold pyridoxal phosphate-dependent enzyme [Ketobacter sp.]|uniref:aminotransferase class I/II-fold pyridoxal phosphate-dependent enzyme n=1 Tax=Ketobacter sp. TaxID=2083498 RepID=UPI000F1116E4|nr:aminotransferase class I/II-fold pyridoxal phosphate-dependent enzyme [Ketobacter sp.]RLT92476.1 MAG: aminotransferase class I/II-fold pyridoxal phosphate-dependent enzyme [Ketobacter sp.]
MFIDQASAQDLQAQLAELEKQYAAFQSAKLNLDLTRGKPNSAQLDLSNGLDGILTDGYKAADGTDCRNYGGLDGLPEAKALFSQVLGVTPAETLIGGNASLTLMFQTMAFAHFFGVRGAQSAWSREGEIKFLCPVPGYDRHFGICEELGITMIPVAMDENGPLMDEVEALVKADPCIKGIWCVPRFSNPTGIVYSDEVVDRIARLAKIAGANFRVMWDNAYAIHALSHDAPALANVMDAARKQGTEDSIVIFGSTSKVTFAGSGLAFMGTSEENLKHFKKHLGMGTIGPDKVNQLRHVTFFGDYAGLLDHMDKHAELLKPRFDAVLQHLDEGFSESDMGSWTVPEGGYFVSFDSRPGLAKEIVRLALEAGVKLTPAGATFPYGQDPEDKNIRLAPSFPSLQDINKTMEVFVVCVKLASIRQKLS